MPTPRVPIAERLAKNSRRDPATGCRVWTASRMKKGYGTMRVAGRTKRAHRVAWEEERGPIPPGLDVLHDCPCGDDRACIEIEHLWLGTNQDNVDDKIRKGRESHKGPQGEAHPKAKLNNEQVYAIRADRRRHRIVAKEYGIRKEHVSNIQRRRSWAHLP